MITNALAQSFFVTEKTGYFLTRVKLYVNAKSNTVPLKVEIRQMDNGFPSTKVLQYGSVVIPATSITASGTTPISGALTVKFDSPVYLKGETEYCIVVLSDSNEYKMWVARGKETDVNTGKLITTQPESGTIFYSQNGSTWQPRETDDLMFELYRAKFKTERSAQFTATNSDIGWAPVRSNPLRVWNGKTRMRIRAALNGMKIGDYVVLRGVSIGSITGFLVTGQGSGYTSTPTVSFSGGGGTGASAVAIIKDGKVVGLNILNTGVDYTTAPTVSFSGGGGTGASAIVNISNGNMNIKSSDINFKPLRVLHYDNSTIMVDLGIVSNYDGEFGGSNISLKRNIRADLFLPKGDTILFPNTDAKYSFSITDYNTSKLDQERSCLLNEIYEFDDSKRILSDINENRQLDSQESLLFNAVLTSNTDYLSPMIDLTSLSATLTINRIDGWIPENVNVVGYDDETILTGATTQALSNGMVITTAHDDIARLAQGKILRVSGYKNFVKNLVVTNAGIGYTSAPTLTLPAPTTGSGVTATATATMLEGSINSINMTEYGSGYLIAQNGASVTIGAPNAALWLVGTTYNVDDIVKNSSNNVYLAVTGGTGGTEPSHTSGSVSNGQVTWKYLGPLTQAVATILLSSNNGDYTIKQILSDTPTTGDTTVELIGFDDMYNILDTIKIRSTSTEPSPAIVYQLLGRDISMLAAKNSSNNFNYLTKVVNLKNMSTGFKVFFDINNPPEVETFVFYRICNKSKQENIHNLPWILMKPSNPIPKIKNKSIFTEIEFGEDTDIEFDQIQVKVAAKTTSTAKFPRFKNYRMIVLA